MHKEDTYLWQGIKQGDDLAFKTLFNRYYKSLCIYALQILNSLPDSEDIVQGVFVSLWTKREELYIKTSLKAYLYKSVFNACIQNVRRERKIDESLEFLKWKMLRNQVEEDDTVLFSEIEKLKKIVDTLPNRCKEILLLSKIEGYKNREIASDLGISIKTVESHMRIEHYPIKCVNRK